MEIVIEGLHKTGNELVDKEEAYVVCCGALAEDFGFEVKSEVLYDMKFSDRSRKGWRKAKFSSIKMPESIYWLELLEDQSYNYLYSELQEHLAIFFEGQKKNERVKTLWFTLEEKGEKK